MSLFKTRSLQARTKLARAQARQGYIKAHNGYRLPSWLEIHHKDFCPLNNDPGNWECISRQRHIDIHGKDGDNERSRMALNNYLDTELECCLNDLTLWLNIYNNKLCD